MLQLKDVNYVVKDELGEKAILKNDDSVSNSSNLNDTRGTTDASDSADQNEEMPDEIKDILSYINNLEIFLILFYQEGMKH